MNIARKRFSPQLCLSCLALLTVAASALAANRPGPSRITRDSLQYLLPGPGDLPWDAVLRACHHPDIVANLDISNPDMVVWEGPPVAARGAAVTEPRFTIIVRMEAVRSPDVAVRFAAKEAKSPPAAHTEITGKPLVRSFSDRAWLYLGYVSFTKNAASANSRDMTRQARLIFTRANVWVSIGISRRNDPFPVMLLADLGEHIGQRIDALKVGARLPLTVLPLGAWEQGIDGRDAWQAGRSTTLLGKPATTIVLRYGKTLPRSMRAVRITSRDYVVPLVGLQVVMHGDGGGWPEVDVEGNRATARILGRSVEVTKGSSRARIDGKTVRLSRPAEFRGTRVFVPLSLMDSVLGRKPTWTTVRGKPAVQW